MSRKSRWNITVFGVKWDEHPIREMMHIRSELPTGEPCYVQCQDEFGKDPGVFCCVTCEFPFRQFLVDDKLWEELPIPLRKEVICPSCFACIRYLTKGNTHEQPAKCS